MKRGGLRWNEEAFAAFCGKRSRFAAGTINGPEADAATDSAPPSEARLAVRTPIRADAASKPTHPLIELCRVHGIPEPIAEFRFHLTRRWRFDYAWPLYKLALEVEGGIWTQGRHTRGAGAVADLEKYSEAALAGWRLLYVQPRELRTVGMDYLFREFA